MLQTGIPAPAFTLSDQDGNPVSLSDYKGKKVILYFYPRDNTPGCSKQAYGFKELYDQITEMGAVVIGVNHNSVTSHKKFEMKYELPFTLLSDKDKEILQAYDVWKEKKSGSMGVVRTTYLIDEDGIIKVAVENVKPEENPGEMLEALKEI